MANVICQGMSLAEPLAMRVQQFTKSLRVIDYISAMVQAGFAFGSLYRTQPGAPLAKDTYIDFLARSQGLVIHAFASIQCNGLLDFSMAPVLTTTDPGTPVLATNKNLGDPRAPTAEVFVDPTVTHGPWAAGRWVFETYESTLVRVLPRNASFLLRITNQSGKDAHFNFALDWLEQDGE